MEKCSKCGQIKEEAEEDRQHNYFTQQAMELIHGQVIYRSGTNKEAFQRFRTILERAIGLSHKIEKEFK